MNKTLYVGGLPYRMDSLSLENLFMKAGTVVSAKVILDRDTGRSKGFGFVEMSSAAEAQRVIQQLHGSEQGGRTITVTEARPEGPRPSGPSRARSTFNVLQAV